MLIKWWINLLMLLQVFDNVSHEFYADLQPYKLHKQMS